MSINYQENNQCMKQEETLMNIVSLITQWSTIHLSYSLKCQLQSGHIGYS